MADVTVGAMPKSATNSKGWLIGLQVLARRWVRARRDRADLARMDERARRDAGLSISEVRTVYRQPRWRWPLN